jgi:hypothetical protein
VGLCPKRRKIGGGFVDGLKRQSCLGLWQLVTNIMMELADCWLIVVVLGPCVLFLAAHQVMPRSTSVSLLG